MSILNPLFEAVAWMMMQIHAGLSHLFGASSGATWGLSIVLLVVLMRLIMVPLFIKQRNSMLKMQSHQPQLQEIRKRFKHDKQKLNEETMKFYKENGINPLGGCLPLVAQMPVFWALFEVLRAIAEWTPGTTPSYGLTTSVVQSARSAQIFGVTLYDSFLRPVAGESMSSRIIILCFVLVSGITTFLTMRQSKRRGMMNQTTPDPDAPGAATAQALSNNMMYVAPLFALTGLYWQFGLVIYWVTTNVWTLGQQHFLFRNLPVVGSAAVGASATQAAAGSSSAKSAAAASAGKAAGGAAKSATTAKPGTTRKPAVKDGKSSTSSAKAAAPKVNGAKPAANGSASASSGLRRKLGKKEEPQDVPVAPPTKVVRQQPVRQTRSKRGNTGKG